MTVDENNKIYKYIQQISVAVMILEFLSSIQYLGKYHFGYHELKLTH